MLLGELDEAARLAEQVLPLVKDADAEKDYWAACTLGELYLMQRDFASAGKTYQNVVDCHPMKVGDLRSTRDQADKLCKALSASDAERAQVLAPFQLIGL